METSLPPPPCNPLDPTPWELQLSVRVTSHHGAQMGGGGLLGANSLVTKPPREEKNLCQLAHSPAPRLHLEPNTAGERDHLTDLVSRLVSLTSRRCFLQAPGNHERADRAARSLGWPVNTLQRHGHRRPCPLRHSWAGCTGLRIWFKSCHSGASPDLAEQG